MLIDTGVAKTVPSYTVEVKYSPNIEIAASLHALSTGKADGFPGAWAAETMPRLDGDHLSELRDLAELTSQWSLVMDLFSYLELTNITDSVRFIDDLGRLDRVEFAFGMLSGLVAREEIARIVDDSDLVAEWDCPEFSNFMDIGIARTILSDATRLRDRVASFVEWYWREVFSETWKDIGVAEMEKVKSEKALLSALGPEQYLELCTTGLSITDDAVVFDRGATFTYMRSSFSNVDVFISAFVGESLMVDCIERCLTVYKGIELGDVHGMMGKEGVFSFLRAINGETKMRILMELYKEPKTTKELSDILGIAPSTVSVHLKMMRDAEIIYPQRVQNAVYNRFLVENYQALLSYLQNYFV